jgi:hypothetical protein
LVLGEIALKKIEKNRKKNVPDYIDTRREAGLGFGGHLRENFQEQVVDGYGGVVTWINNSVGFRTDREFSRAPPPGVLRILSMGDSFTAGYRVDQKDTYSYLIEQYLNQSLGKTEVLISCVDNPPTGLYYLDRFGLSYHPHVVLLGITLGNDISEVYIGLDPQGSFVINDESGIIRIEKKPNGSRIGFRHGLEKYDLPENCLYEKGTFEKIAYRITKNINRYRILSLIRSPACGIRSWYGSHNYDRPKLFDAVHGLGFYIASPPPVIEESYRRLYRLLSAFKRYCMEKNILLIVCLFPQRFQLQEKCWEKTRQKYSLNESAFDLNAPNRKIVDFCNKEKLVCIDPSDAMREIYEQTGEDLYLPRGDMHWNRVGNKALFEAAKDEIEKTIIPLFHTLRENAGP